MREKKYRLRNGVVVVPEIELGWVRVVDTQDAVFTDSSSACCTARELSQFWAVGARNALLRPCTADPLSWEGGVWGEQFDAIAEVVEATPTPRDVESAARSAAWSAAESAQAGILREFIPHPWGE